MVGWRWGRTSRRPDSDRIHPTIMYRRRQGEDKEDKGDEKRHSVARDGQSRTGIGFILRLGPSQPLTSGPPVVCYLVLFHNQPSAKCAVFRWSLRCGCGSDINMSVSPIKILIKILINDNDRWRDPRTEHFQS